MAKSKEVTYYNNRFRGSLTELQCAQLENVISANERCFKTGECFEDLSRMIFRIDDAAVLQYIEDMETLGYSAHEFEKPYGMLKPFQTIGAAFMYFAKACILGDSVGMGKTVEVAAVMNMIKTLGDDANPNHRYLLLTQKNLVHQVRREMIRFTGEFVQIIESGEQKCVQNFMASNPYECDLEYSIVGTHALLTTKGFIQWLELARTNGNGFPFDTLIIDESSVLGGSNTQVVNGFKLISKYFSRIYFLNATPFETHLETFYNQLNLLDKSFLPTKTNFKKEYEIMDYRGMYPRPTGKYKNQENFKRLVAYRYFARTRRDTGGQMYDCDGRVVLSELSQIQKEWLYKSQLHRVVYDCPTYLDPSIEFNSENIPKLASLNSLLRNECEDANSVIIFVYFKEAQKYLAQWLENKGYAVNILNGSTDNRERQRIIDWFSETSNGILITNVQRGLNFGKCNYCIFYSFDPNPSSMVQFEGRITRDIDIVNKHVYILCSKGKEYRTLNEVIRQRAKAITDFTNTDLSIIMNILLNSGEEE